MSYSTYEKEHRDQEVYERLKAHTVAWSLQFIVDDETDDVEGQIHAVGNLCRHRGINFIELLGTRRIMLYSSTSSDEVDNLIIDATRQGCKVTAVRAHA